MTALVSVQMLESSRATITDAVVHDALKTLAVRQQIPDGREARGAALQDRRSAGFRVVITAQNGIAVLTQGPKDAVDDVEQPFVLIERRDRRGTEAGGARQVRPAAFSSAPGIKDIRITRCRAAAHRPVERTRDRRRGQGRDEQRRRRPRCSGCASVRTRICRCSRSRSAPPGTRSIRSCARSATGSSARAIET